MIRVIWCLSLFDRVWHALRLSAGILRQAATEVSEAQTPDEVISEFCSRAMCDDYIGGDRIGMYSRSFRRFS
jgi:hypothetical protein